MADLLLLLKFKLKMNFNDLAKTIKTTVFKLKQII